MRRYGLDLSGLVVLHSYSAPLYVDMRKRVLTADGLPGISLDSEECSMKARTEIVPFVQHLTAILLRETHDKTTVAESRVVVGATEEKCW